MNKLFALGFLFLLASSCASHPDVRPGLDGIHTITVHGEEVKDTESNANKQIRSYCKDMGKIPDYLSDESFKATDKEVDANAPMKEFKKAEAAATDVKFKCVDKQ
ncbi:MAG: hypothetical protein H7336_16665 [Bacteriovorax sp.]|nr:hypothetical protein [Bacteriovorax sp.]